MMKKSSNFITDFVGSLSISCALFHDFVDDEKEFKVSLLNNMEKFLKKASPKDINNLIMSLKKSLFKFTNYEYSWIFVDGLDFSFFALDILFLLIKKEAINDEILLQIILSDNALLGYDFRGATREMLLQIAPTRTFTTNEIVSIKEKLLKFESKKQRDLLEKMHIKTDGIDHLFPIPSNGIKKINILQKATNYKLCETIFLDLISLLSHYKNLEFLLKNDKITRNLKILKKIYNNAQYSLSANKLLESEINIFGRTAFDYLVAWDQEITEDYKYHYTIAELLKMIMLTSAFKLPDYEIRLELIKFYKQVLKISEEANIGLGSAIFRAEHGIYERPTTFFLGRKSVIGKGCILETTGGIIISEYAFVGGGFIPLLVHTHMHKSNLLAANERKCTVPVVMYMQRGSRIPMDQAINFEVAKYIKKEAPFEGVFAFQMDN